jgi:hypothetical protein
MANDQQWRTPSEDNYAILDKGKPNLSGTRRDLDMGSLSRTQQSSKLDGIGTSSSRTVAQQILAAGYCGLSGRPSSLYHGETKTPSYGIFYTGAGSMKSVVRLESSEPLSQVFEIPGPALNEKLVPMNDNSKLTSLSGENFEAGSILAPRDYNKPRNSHQIGLVVTIALCLIALATFNMLLLK